MQGWTPKNLRLTKYIAKELEFTKQLTFNKYDSISQMRPTTGPMRKDGVKPKHAIFRNSSQPPKGMHINHDDLVALATGPPGQGEGLLRALDREIVSYKRLVQNNKQMLSSLRRKARERDVEPYRQERNFCLKVLSNDPSSEFLSQQTELMPGGQMKNCYLLFKVFKRKRIVASINILM